MCLKGLEDVHPMLMFSVVAMGGVMKCSLRFLRFLRFPGVLVQEGVKEKRRRLQRRSDN